MTGNEKIIGRIKKLIALAQDAGASEGERDNAIRFAHKTLAAYNITMAEVEASGGSKGEPRIDGEHQTIAHPWIRNVHSAIAKLHFCEYFYVRHHGSKVTHHIIGRESNCITAKEMSLFVGKAIASEAGKQRRQNCLDGTWERDFCKGAAHAVYHRCASLRAEAEREQQPQSANAPGTAIVLASLYATESEANKALIARLHGKLTTGRAGRSAGWDAYSAGSAFGKAVSLNRQVGNASPNNPRLK